jgi:putative FmdB family regulatory protein
MPAYEFICEICGPFECWRSFDECSQPMLCPTCKAAARRVYSAPGLVRTPHAIAKALQREEKSTHEPEVVTRPRPAREEAAVPAYTYQRHGRPWQLGH